jgi:uncharacterized protein YbjT (DUF2867 family)
MLVSGYWMLVAGYWLLDAGSWIFVTRYSLLVSRYLSLAPGKVKTISLAEFTRLWRAAENAESHFDRIYRITGILVLANIKKTSR